MKVNSWDYVAGFFDGEGCLYVCRHKKSVAVYLLLAQKERTVLDEIAKFLGEKGIYARVEGGKSKAGFQLRVSRQEEVIEVLVRLVPRLVVKRERALECLNYMKKVKTLKDRYGNQYWRYAPEVTAPSANRKVA